MPFPTNVISAGQAKKIELQQAILITLKNCAPPNNTLECPLPPPSTWPSTRYIADAHDISVYKARLILLDMVEKGLIIVSERAINNSLRWFLAP